MSTIKNAFHHLMYDRWKFIDQFLLKYGAICPDKLYLRLRFRCVMGYWPNFSNPRTFQEKINWLKLYNRNEKYTTLVDKYAVKEWVEKRIGSKYIIPTIGVWNTPKEIDWNILPHRFVLKTTHGGGGGSVIICRDKNHFDVESAKMKLSLCMKKNIYNSFREWPYKNVKRRIIAETYKEEKNDKGEFSHDLSDYKFFCFNGEPTYCQVIRNRHTKEVIDFYTMEWEHMDFVGLNPKCLNGENGVVRPSCLDEMINVCKVLSSGIPFVRVDLYFINGSVYFGEMTFFPAGGFGRFTPTEWNIIMGNKIILDNEKSQK